MGDFYSVGKGFRPGAPFHPETGTRNHETLTIVIYQARSDTYRSRPRTEEIHRRPAPPANSSASPPSRRRPGAVERPGNEGGAVRAGIRRGMTPRQWSGPA